MIPSINSLMLTDLPTSRKNRQCSTFRIFILSEADKENSDNWDLHHEDFEILKGSTDCVSQIAGTECRVLDWRDTCLPEAVRHLSIIRPPSSTGRQQQNIILSNSLINDVIHRRSLIFLGNMLPVRMSGQMLDKLASNLRYLRVLDLQDMALQVLPSSVGMLVHLRYLDLSRNNFRRLPRSICKLKNLLTLKLVYCDKLVRLPQRIRNLHCLKNLEINMCWDLTHLPSTIARMTCLEGLDQLIVSPHTGGLRYLEQLNKLKGCLSIELPQQWKESVVDAEGAYLDRKKGITALDFKWQSARNGDEKNDGDDVLEKLKPCSGIENLFIVNYGGKKFPSWISSLDSLTIFTISKCKSCEILPSFHKMPHLRSLTLTSLNIEYIEDDNHSDHVFYPSLKELKIGRMHRLKGWSRGLCKVANGLPRFGHINKMEIWKCPCLTVMPSFSNIGNLILQDVYEKTLQLNDWGSCYSIEIISIQGMVLLPNQFAAKAPRMLTIRDCNQLRTLWAGEVEGTDAWKSYVGNLSVINCPAIKHLSDNLKHLTVLHNLTLSKCNEELDCLYYEDEDGMPWKALRKLTCLTIEGFENLVALPRSLQHLPYLRELEIRDCKALKWEVDRAPKMRSLSDLIFKACPHITPVTEELKRAYRAKGVRVTG